MGSNKLKLKLNCVTHCEVVD